MGWERKEAAMAYLEVLSRHSLRWIEESHEKASVPSFPAYTRTAYLPNTRRTH